MLWFALALLFAAFSSAQFALLKKWMKQGEEWGFAGGAFLLSGLLLLAASAARGFPAIGDGFAGAAIATVLLNFAAAWLYLRALMESELSRTMPLLSFTAVFAIFTSWAIIGESVSALGAAGILAAVGGAYLLNAGGGATALEPFRLLFTRRESLYMLGVALIFSVSSVYDKVVFLNTDELFGSGAVNLSLGLVFLAYSAVLGGKGMLALDARRMAIVAGFIAAAAALFALALGMQQVAYVSAVTRASSLFSVIIGAAFFGERDIRVKMAGALLLAAGGALLLLA